ncbi:ATP-dependent serine protease [Barnesiella viscericola]|uniref:ATP-dependent serine protease n=1 Tax=Barnesiella viscericola TaxID=397865 RepID=UPI0025A4B3AD|nr:ATP-dependent serine protease [Barnesiella viscericola]MDM8269008.1 ATP-dependent serine protease [Barnesiella viscericola]
MGRAISNKNVLTAKFEVTEFDGAFLASFGKPELRGAWIIYGGSGSGKTSFVMQVCKYLTRFRRVAYDSLEQGLSLSLQKAWERVGMEEVGNRIILLNKESLKDLRLRLAKKQSPDVVVVDSVHYWLGLKMSDYINLRNDFPDKLFIFVSHEKGGQPDGKLAQKIRYDSDIKIRVEGYKAFVTTRYEVAERGEGGADFIIWEQGAQDYWVDKM